MWLPGCSRPSLADAVQTLALYGVIVAAVLFAYGRSVEVPFLFDDYPAIVRNESIRKLWPAAPVLNPPVTAAGAAGRPLVNLSLAVDHALGGDDPRGYHRTNTVLHALTACLLGAVLRRTLRLRGQPGGEALAFAAVGGLLWAVHPLLSESVVCVIQRNEILFAASLLGTLYGLVRSGTDARSPWLFASALFGVAGAGCKEVAVVTPAVVLLFDRAFLAGSFVAALRSRKGFYLALCAVWPVVAWLVATNNERAGTVGFGLGVTSWDYAVTQCRAIGIYLKLVVWPTPLVIDYGDPLFREFKDVAPGAVLVMAGLAFAAYSVVRNTAAGFLAGTFFLLLAPSSSFVPLTTQTIAEHRMYLATAALLLLGGLLFSRLAPRVAIPIGLVLVFAFSAVTRSRVETYTDEIALWRQTIAAVPDSPRARASLATALVRQERWSEAIPPLREALRLRPEYADAHNDLALVLLRTGSSTEALVHHLEAARLKPRDPDIRYNLGRAHLQLGDATKAIAAFDAALRLRASFETAREALGTAYNARGLQLMEQRQYREAAAAFEFALREAPRLAAAHINAADAYAELGERNASLQHLAAAARLLPDHAEVRYNHGAMLATLGRTAEALAELEAALRIDPAFVPAQQAVQQLRR